MRIRRQISGLEFERLFVSSTNFAECKPRPRKGGRGLRSGPCRWISPIGCYVVCSDAEVRGTRPGALAEPVTVRALRSVPQPLATIEPVAIETAA
jgi:hypothetical protein